MRLSQGVEWAVHASTLLAPLPPGGSLSLVALAEFHGLGRTYMAKQMQLLSRAGIVLTRKGAKGGYALAKPAEAISLYDIVRAIEGPGPSFLCTEIRQQGPCGKPAKDRRVPCGIAAAFHAAETAWRQSLSQVTIADMAASAARTSSPDQIAVVIGWLQGRVSAPTVSDPT